MFYSYEIIELYQFHICLHHILICQPPEYITRWNDELSATQLPNECIQYTSMPKDPNEPIEGDEDCLYLNIYVPVRNNNTKQYSVIFFIHGGCFIFGSGGMYGEKYLMDKDLIYITINYRLGALGI